MIPRTLFDADLDGFRDSVRKFLEQEAAPHHAQWEKDGQVSRELWQQAGELGCLCPTMPEEYSGVVIEEVSRAGLSGIGWSLHSDIVAPYILKYGSEEQKKHYLPKMASGEIITAIAMSEPGAGSDLQGVKTTALKDGDHYILNGSKTFVTNGQMADLVIVVVKTDPKEGAKGISLLLVEAAWEGFEKGQNLKKVGMKAQDTSELFFQDVKVPATHLLGSMEGQGFFQLMQELPAERLQIGLAAIAAAEAAWQWTLDYVKERKAFGKPVIKFQNTRFKMAEMKAEITAARVFTDRCLELHLEKKLDIPTAAMLK